MILATGVTGFGTGVSEHEYVVMSGIGSVHHQVHRRYGGKLKK